MLEFTLEDIFIPLHNTRHLEHLEKVQNELSPYKRFEEKSDQYITTIFNSILWTSMVLYLFN